MAMTYWRNKKEKHMPSYWFLKNGRMFLQELIADSNGVSNPIRMFSSDQISKATDQFDFDTCSYDFFTGVIEGRSYAIKKHMPFRGEVLPDFFDEIKPDGYNDIVLSARVSNHNGFLKLIGCCLEFPFAVGVFENPKYGVLNERGSVGCEDAPLLPWNVRLKIAKDVAIAITYLHTAFPRIIFHRDINPRNVFLDKNWNAKLSGFSYAVTLPEGKTWIEDDVMGTAGYIDPTYLRTGLVTEYSDVFSFGIFMLVLLMGKPACGLNGVHFKILDYFKDLQERGELVELGDGSNDMRPGQMKMFLELALRCCAEWNHGRPKMIQVAKEIKLIERSPKGCCLNFPSPVVVESPEYGRLNERGSVGCEDAPLLPWNVRLKIAKEVATAITNLHTTFPGITIHRDIKATNVFLDKNWNAKLSGFSNAVTLPEGKSWIEHSVRGTIGYVDPTYRITGLVTEYLDVYSFGIFMLVLLMGRPALGMVEDIYNILEYVKNLRKRGAPVKFGGDTNDMRPGQMKMFLKLALRCCAERNQHRPKMILVANEINLIERSLDCNVLETGSPFWSDIGGRDEEEEGGRDEEEEGGRDEEEELYGR